MAAAARHQPLHSADTQLDPRLADLAHGRKTGQAHANPFQREAARLRRSGRRQQLAHREQPDHNEDRLHARQKLRQAEGEPADAGDRIGADRRDHQAEDRGEQPLEQRLAGQARDHAEAEHAEREVGGRRERERDARSGSVSTTSRQPEQPADRPDTSEMPSASPPRPCRFIS